MAANNDGWLIIERILRDRDGIWKQIADERDLRQLIGQMLATSAVALALYGAVLGAFNSFWQAISSAGKLPLLFLMTLAICLPTLYLFNLVFGARLQVKQAIALVMVTITVTSVLAMAFAPISLFFLITANHYSFYKLLNVTILALSAVIGLRFLTAGMNALNIRNAEMAAAKRAEEAASVDAQKRATAETAAERSEPAEAQEAVESGDAVPAAATDGKDGSVVVTLPAPAPSKVVEPANLPVPVGAGAPAAVQAAQPMAQMVPVQHAVPMYAVHPNGQPVPYGYHQPLGVPVPHQQPQVAPAEKSASMTLLYVWIALFGFVGTQLAWTLRPFLGSRGEPFQIFRKIDGNFYVDVVRTLGNLF